MHMKNCHTPDASSIVSAKALRSSAISFLVVPNSMLGSFGKASITAFAI